MLVSKYVIFYIFGMPGRHVQAVSAVPKETGYVFYEYRNITFMKTLKILTRIFYLEDTPLAKSFDIVIYYYQNISYKIYSYVYYGHECIQAFQLLHCMQDNGDFVNRGHTMAWSPLQGVLQNVRR